MNFGISAEWNDPIIKIHAEKGRVKESITPRSVSPYGSLFLEHMWLYFVWVFYSFGLYNTKCLYKTVCPLVFLV